MAIQAAAQGLISATALATYQELDRQHGPWLDRRGRGLTYAMLAGLLRRSYSTVWRDLQELKAAGLVTVIQRYRVENGQARQAPPLFMFPRLDAPVAPAVLAAGFGRALSHLQSKTVRMTATYRTRHKTRGESPATDAGEPRSPDEIGHVRQVLAMLHERTPRPG